MTSLLRSFASKILTRWRLYDHSLPVDVTAYLRSVALNFFTLLLSLRPRYMRKGGLNPTKKAHITSYLDALRGWAAIIVLNSHHFPYKRAWIIDQPFVRIVLHGRGMVDVFFVISGYVLSYRMLKLIRTQQAIPLLDAVVSSVFRRYIRLYGSAAAASFVPMLLVASKLIRSSLHRQNFASQLWHWAVEFVRFSNVFANVEGFWHRGVFSNKYLDVLWSIPVEFRGSMIIFTFCVGACKLSTRNRMLLCWFLMVLAWYWTAVYIALFLGGLFLADLSFTWHPDRLGSPPSLPVTCLATSEALPRFQSLPEKAFYSSILICALFLLSQPDNLPKGAWPWPFLDGLIPNQYRASGINEHWWLGIGALLLVWALDSYPTLQTPFKWNFSRYLGDLSFGIYVMHVPILWTVWKSILNPLRLILLGDARWSYAPIMLLNYGAILWAADLFIRVDQRVVALGKWTQERFFVW